MFKTKKTRYFPKYSILIGLVSLIVVVYWQWMPENRDNIFQFAIIPSKFLHSLHQDWMQIMKLFSALLIHGNWNHWFGNMLLFLLIGPILERKVGGFWFLLMFFISGFLGNLYSIYQLQESQSYLLGASGAVSGLLGVWLMLYPRHQISIIIPIGLYIQRAKIPIVIILLIWLALQVLLQYVSSVNFPVVWGAHIIGFVSGLILGVIYKIFR
jgi:membrane associated rhomboid family serine protease